MYIDLRHCQIRENVYRFTTLPNKGECIGIYDIVIKENRISIYDIAE